jgi:hypothetical protein
LTFQGYIIRKLRNLGQITLNKVFEDILSSDCEGLDPLGMPAAAHVSDPDKESLLVDMWVGVHFLDAGFNTISDAENEVFF